MREYRNSGLDAFYGIHGIRDIYDIHGINGIHDLTSPGVTNHDSQVSPNLACDLQPAFNPIHSPY